MADKYQEFKDLQEGRSAKKTINLSNDIQNPIEQSPDSLIKKATYKINNQLTNLNKVSGIKIDSLITEEILDSIKSHSVSGKNFSFILGSNNITKMVNYQKEHPETPMDAALDSLNLKKGFWNRLLYTKAKKINSLASDPEEGGKQFIQELISYASISIFVFLPIFTLFLRFIYIRRKFTYVEHLIFVFHTQTVFFILLTLFYLLGLATGSENIVWIFSVIFLIYLLISIKKFYQQGHIKTFFKFLILNMGYLFLASIGFAILSIVAFAIS